MQTIKYLEEGLIKLLKPNLIIIFSSGSHNVERPVYYMKMRENKAHQDWLYINALSKKYKRRVIVRGG